MSKIQTINNGLSQPHFQGFFSPQLFLKRPKIRHFWSLLSLRKSINTAYEKYIV